MIRLGYFNFNEEQKKYYDIGYEDGMKQMEESDELWFYIHFLVGAIVSIIIYKWMW